MSYASIYLVGGSCKKCKGAKVVKEKKRQEIYVEKGMPDGHRIILQGQGDEEVSNFRW